ncbi:MAG: PQQ-binding-like beta-propeller repeat protein [Fimbriiglobus sp.]
MSNRSVLVASQFALLFGLAAAVPAVAQPPCGSCPPPSGGGRGYAFPPAVGIPGSLPGPAGVFAPDVSVAPSTPSAVTLARLNLRAEWTIYVPMDGRDDGLGPVQWVAGGQVFAQTRSGRLLAYDGVTGFLQWSFRYDTPGANLHPVAVTDRLVFAVNVNTLHCFHRYTGLREFTFDLPGLGFPGAGGPTAGPVADEKNVYVLLGATRIVAYSYPKPLVAPQAAGAAIGPDGRPLPPENKTQSVTDQAAGRLGTRLNRFEEDLFAERTGAGVSGDYSGSGLGAMQKTPSMSSLPRISPPYTLAREIGTPSISSMHSVRQPYQLYPPDLKYQQATPSISALPASATAAFGLANFRPREVEPRPVWAAAAPGRTTYEPIMTTVAGGSDVASQLWLTTDGSLAFAVSKVNGVRQAELPTSARISGPAAGPVAVGEGSLVGYFPLSDGGVIAVDLPAGSRQNPKIEWRANVGGFLNHRPLPTADAVFASGDNAGVAKIDIRTGDVLWRTGQTADHPLAVTDEHVYVLDNRGTMLVFPRSRPAGETDGTARPVGRLDVRGFNVPITNAATDRILLGADSGLVLCLRDASAKYIRPTTVAPPSRLPPPKPAIPGDPAAPAADKGM